MLKATLEQWRMFKAVVDAGGFNQASQVVYKSQSSIHHAVQKLEDSLGVQLLEVVGRKVRLTEGGELMLRRANYLLDEAAKVEAIAEGLIEGTETYLKIAVDEVFPYSILYQALNQVSIQFPLLRIELIETVLSGSIELIENSDVDIAISGFPLKEGFSEELCGIEFIPVANPLHPLHQLNRKITFEDLKSQRQIVVRDSALSQSIDAGWLGANQRWTVSHVRTSIDIISKGLGFAWLPTHAIEFELEQGLLKPLPLEANNRRTGKLHLLFRDGDRLGPAARDFIGALRSLV